MSAWAELRAPRRHSEPRADTQSPARERGVKRSNACKHARSRTAVSSIAERGFV